MTQSEKIRTKLRRAMSDFGYRLSDNRLIELGIRGFSSDRILPYKFRDERDAAEWLIPIISEDRFTDAVIAI